MLILSIEVGGEPARTHHIERLPARIGRAKGCEIELSGWRVGRIHAELRADPRGVRLVDGGSLAGTLVNGQRVAESGPLEAADLIEIAGYRLRVSAMQSPSDAPQTSRAGAIGAASGGQSASVSAAGTVNLGWRRLLHRRLLQTIDLRERDLRGADAVALRDEVSAIVQQQIDNWAELPQEVDRTRLMNDLLDEALGLGPLEALLKDPAVSEIMVNGADEIWVEREGRLAQLTAAFSDDDAVRHVIDRIVSPLGRRIDESSPMVDARLPDGSRVNAVIPPLAVRGPAITIRRFNRKMLAPDDLIRHGAASDAMLEFLRIAVTQRRNIVISGGTGSGKTTLLNLLSNLIPAGERIITIEDSAELALQHAHRVQLEARPANLEGRGEVTIRDLVRNALRMRPDRIVVGECRGGETLDMLQAMNTGHDGSMTTLHANGPRDVVSRLEVMALMAGIDLPLVAVREQIASAVDLIVHQARFHDGLRRIASVMEVTGIEAGRVQMQELFRFDAVRGHQPCDAVPAFYESLREAGVPVDLSIFSRQTA